jgi:hypothetical protein
LQSALVQKVVAISPARQSVLLYPTPQHQKPYRKRVHDPSTAAPEFDVFRLTQQLLEALERM